MIAKPYSDHSNGRDLAVDTIGSDGGSEDNAERHSSYFEHEE